MHLKFQLNKQTSKTRSPKSINGNQRLLIHYGCTRDYTQHIKINKETSFSEGNQTTKAHPDTKFTRESERKENWIT